MRVCVTGGAGYIGSHTCKALAQDGHEVFVYDNLSTGHRDFVRFGEFVYGDINDGIALRRCFHRIRPDAVIHFASSIEVSESVRDPGKYYRNNVGGSLSLLEAMTDEDVPVIVVSGTCAVYGQPRQVPIAETCAIAPLSPYGWTKFFMERMLADFQKAHGLRYMSLRYFNAAGCSPDGDIGELHNPETHLVPNVIRAALGRIPPLNIFGNDYDTPDGTCIRDYIDVRDLARAHVLAVEKLLSGAQSEAVNLGTGRGASVLEIVRGVENISGRKVPYVFSDRRPGDPPRLVADAARAMECLGWQPEFQLSDMLTNAWSFLTSQKQ